MQINVCTRYWSWEELQIPMINHEIAIEAKYWPFWKKLESFICKKIANCYDFLDVIYPITGRRAMLFLLVAFLLFSIANSKNSMFFRTPLFNIQIIMWFSKNWNHRPLNSDICLLYQIYFTNFTFSFITLISHKTMVVQKLTL